MSLDRVITLLRSRTSNLTKVTLSLKGLRVDASYGQDYLEKILVELENTEQVADDQLPARVESESK